MSLSDCCSEELVTVIECEDIDDRSSVNYPDHFYPVPKTLEPDNVWNTSNEEESIDREYNS